VLNFIWFLVGMAFVEGLLKPFLVWLTQRQVRRFLPYLLDRLDPVLPIWISRYTEQELRELVINEIFNVGFELEEPITDNRAEQILETAIQSYSFLANARKNNGSTPA
jgi:hypothetical protein